MRRIRLLILKEWLSSFLVAVLVVYIIIANANLISEVMRNVTTMKNILLNFVLETPDWFIKVLPVSCMIATMFCIRKLQNRNELVAIFASGFSRRSFIGTLLALGFVVGGLTFTLGAHVSPWAKEIRPKVMKGGEQHFRRNQASGIKFSSFSQGQLWYKGRDYFCSFAAFDKYKNELKLVGMYYLAHDSSRISKVIYAKTGKHVGGTKWVLEDAKIYDNLDLAEFPRFSKDPHLHLDMGESPRDFAYLESDISNLNFSELYEYVKNLDKLGINSAEYTIIYYNMIAPAVMCVVFVMMAIFGVYSPNRRGSSFGMSLLFVFVITLVYWLLNSITMSLGIKNYLPAWVSVFALPILLFAFLALRMWSKRRLA